MVFCTLFDSLYLDKALAMHESLVSCCDDIKLYVLAMDDRCFNILSDLDYGDIKLIHLEDILNDELKKVRKDRSVAEFCWTCTSQLISYVINEMAEDICTYIDADLFFYSDPHIIIEEMGDSTVQIIPHWFSDNRRDRLSQKMSGKYCVEFNTFKRSEESLKLLEWWKKQCLLDCSMGGKTDGVLGDQQYINDWDKYPFVNVVSNRGAGIAPWNFSQYKYDSANDLVIHKRTNKSYKMVFYHFHNITYISSNIVKMNIYSDNRNDKDKNLICKTYRDYLLVVDKYKKLLNDRYGFMPLLDSHPGLYKRKNGKTLIERVKSASISKVIGFIKGKIRENIYNSFFLKKDTITF